MLLQQVLKSKPAKMQPNESQLGHDQELLQQVHKNEVICK